MSEIEEKTYKDLYIESGSRHYRIKNDKDEVVFRTTNMRDAEEYLALRQDNDRLRKLLKARGIAPHRIYLLPDEEHRGQGGVGRENSNEVVIVAKGDDREAVVVRHLDTGKEEIVDLEELEPIRGGVYLQSSQAPEPVVQVVVRYDRDFDPESEDDDFGMSVAVTDSEDVAEDIVDDWIEMGDREPEKRFNAVLAEYDEEGLVFRAETSVQKED